MLVSCALVGAVDNPNYIPSEELPLQGDYALVDFTLSLGGHVATVQPGAFRVALDQYLTRLEQGTDLATEELAPIPGAGSVQASPLSKVHISPYIEYRAGASLLKAHRGGVSEAPKGGKRGAIAGFSSAARRRLMYFIASVRRDASLPLFITLTYPENFPDPKQSKKHLDAFFKRFNRAYPEHGTVWKLEPQERGAPHFHLMAWGCELSALMEFIPSAWYDIAGGGDEKHLLWHCGKFGNQHCVQQVRKFEGVRSYASKYLGKTFEVAGWSEKWTGRFWGVVNRSNIPLGELVQEEVTREKAIELLRYERRFSGLNKFRTNKSLTIFCDASQWIEKVLK